MINIIDHGCSEHHRRQLLLHGSEGELLKEIIFNLPRCGNYLTFICEFGHTHSLSYLVEMDRMAHS